MKRSRFSEEQIISILREHQAGLGAKELCCKHGISDATFYTWRSKYGGMEVSDARRLKTLESENGPVTILCRPKCSFKPPSVRKRRGFSSRVQSVAVADYRTRLCIRRSPPQPAAAFPMTAARSAQP